MINIPELKAVEVKPCPWCGRLPEFIYRSDINGIYIILGCSSPDVKSCPFGTGYQQFVKNGKDFVEEITNAYRLAIKTWNARYT